jgi:deoxyribodipyrimidine photo-lyase
MVKKIGLFIFRRDCRLVDNNALNELAKQVDEIIPIFILDPNQIKKNNKNKYYFSNNAVQFICETLIDLDKQLKEYGSHLYLFMGEPDKIVHKIIKDYDIEYVAFNLDFSPYAIKRDHHILKLCEQEEINCITNDWDLNLLPTEKMLNSGKPFKVYGAYYKHAVKYNVDKPKNLPKVKFISHFDVSGLYPISHLKKLYKENELIDQRGGLEECQKKINALKKQKDYNTMRDRLDYETTHLSAYLNMGTISIRQAYYLFKSKLGSRTQLLKQLYWRDFYHCAIRFIDNASSYTNYIDSRFDDIKWRKSTEFKKEFDKMWYSKTGFLLIDAGMRQLQTTGFLHNRCRMQMVIFANKYLRINMLDPKYGSQVWFSRLLVDAIGIAQNKMNNNWSLDFDLSGRRFGIGISGRGMDISNIEIKKFDPECNYIKKWLPHLKDIPNKDLYKWSDEMAEKYKHIHPAPMFDSKERYQEWIKLTKHL